MLDSSMHKTSHLVHIHTSAGHLHRVRVRPVVAVAADAVGSPLVGGAAVHGALQALLISLGWFEVSRWACWVKDRQRESRKKSAQTSDHFQRTFCKTAVVVSEVPTLLLDRMEWFREWSVAYMLGCCLGYYCVCNLTDR